jgi:hypothetical protein
MKRRASSELQSALPLSPSMRPEIHNASASASPASSRTLSLEPDDLTRADQSIHDPIDGQDLFTHKHTTSAESEQTTENNLNASQQDINAEHHHTSSTEESEESARKQEDANVIDEEILAQYQRDLEERGCYFDLDDGEDEDEDAQNDNTLPKAAPKASRPSDKTEISTERGQSKELHFGNLPLIDIWVAQAKGYTQEEIEEMEGYKKEDEGSVSEGDGEWPPIVQMLCDGRSAGLERIDWESICVEMIPDEDDEGGP